MNEEKQLEIEIEPGMKDGQEYPFISEGGGSHMIHTVSIILHLCFQVSLILMVNQEISYSQYARKSELFSANRIIHKSL